MPNISQSILRKISPWISLEGMMLKLKLQYFGHLLREVDSLKRLWCCGGLGPRGKGDDRGWDGWMASPTRRTWVWVNSGSWWWTGSPGMPRFMGSQKVRHDWATELNWRLPLSEGPSLWDHGPWTQNCCSVTQASWRDNLLAEVSVFYYFILSSTFSNLVFQIETSRLLL